jgi:hypothetical protein
LHQCLHQPGWVDWIKCPAHESLKWRICGQGGPLYQRDILAEEIFLGTSGFRSKMLFSVSSKARRRIIGWLQGYASGTPREEQYLVRDSNSYPRQPYNERGTSLT